MTKPRRRKSRAPAPSPPLPTPLSGSPSSAPPSSSSQRKRKRRRASHAPRATPVRALASRRRNGWLTALSLLALLALSSLAALWVWAVLPGAGRGQAFVVRVASTASPADLAAQLLERGALKSPQLFRAYLALLQPGFEVTAGEHLLNDSASARQLAERLSRGSARASQHITLPEGFHALQIAQRLEHAEVCTLDGFRRAVSDAALLRELNIAGPSAEGYLFPASYGLLVDSDARDVVRVLVRETKKRLQQAFERHPGRLAALQREFGFGEREILILASMIEKEAQASDERPLIASVFFNRLRDPNFRPARMLQSDPTAGYGCVWAGAEIPSCSGFHGSVTPALLRDPTNPYNTYRHPGLPPGPIANPGEASIDAVLAPAETNFLYFVAKGGGRHAFSRTFAEHREALETPH